MNSNFHPDLQSSAVVAVLAEAFAVVAVDRADGPVLLSFQH